MFLVHWENSLTFLILMFDGKKGKEFMAQSLKPVAKESTPFDQAAAAHVEAQGVHADEHAARVIKENEAAVQDSVEEEHIPHNGPEDDESEDEEPAVGTKPAVGADKKALAASCWYCCQSPSMLMKIISNLDLSEITRVNYNILLAHLFLNLTFKVRVAFVKLFYYFYCY
jgi:hypothetical protein